MSCTPKRHYRNIPLIYIIICIYTYIYIYKYTYIYRYVCLYACTHTHLLSVTIPLISHSYPVLARITQAFLCHQWHALSRAPAALHGRQAFDKLQRPTEQEAPGFSTSNLGEIYGFLWEWRIYLIYLQFKTSERLLDFRPAILGKSMGFCENGGFTWFTSNLRLAI